jgi:hypothetical protein
VSYTENKEQDLTLFFAQANQTQLFRMVDKHRVEDKAKP